MFANELASGANVSIEYIVSDVLSLSSEHESGNQDLVLMELGVLHYLIDLQPLFEKIKMMLKPGGRFVLHEFHPISTKLITSNGKNTKSQATISLRQSKTMRSLFRNICRMRKREPFKSCTA